MGLCCATFAGALIFSPEFRGMVKGALADGALPGVDVFPALPDARQVQERIEGKMANTVAVKDSTIISGGGNDAYELVKKAVLTWDVYGGDTKVYLPKGKVVIEKDMVIGISTKLVKIYPLSFEDVAEFHEHDGEDVKRLRVVVGTRKENIVDGNYDVELTLFKKSGNGRQKGDVEIYYQKRQNLTYWLLQKGASLGGKKTDEGKTDEGKTDEESVGEYERKTKISVRKTLDRLRAFGEGKNPAKGSDKAADEPTYPDKMLAVVSDGLLPGVDVFPALPTDVEVQKRIEEKEKIIVACEKCEAITKGGQAAYDRIKQGVSVWDIYGGDTKVYLPKEKTEIKKDMIIAISTKLVKNVYPLSFEDVNEFREVDYPAYKQLRAVVGTRQENIVDGNYDVVVTLFKEDGKGHSGVAREASDVEIHYQKRQNLTYWVMQKKLSIEKYREKTQESVDKTLEKLLAMGKGKVGGGDNIDAYHGA
mmetsp:Transcript_43512/g.114709  ORF Transcript_43512/g.114709 Transcript_43512/m.114709 type:complete len:477 (+) Transcript_43512:101-1531(+)